MLTSRMSSKRRCWPRRVPFPLPSCCRSSTSSRAHHRRKCARCSSGSPADYEGHGVAIKETATGFRFQVRTEFAPEVSRLWPDRPRKYSRALLETLALIAYRQPITRAEIENVRGVAVNPEIVKTLMERNWVRVVGHRDVPGQPGVVRHHRRSSSTTSR